jgi:hypothetical protein
LKGPYFSIRIPHILENPVTCPQPQPQPQSHIIMADEGAKTYKNMAAAQAEINSWFAPEELAFLVFKPAQVFDVDGKTYHIASFAVRPPWGRTDDEIYAKYKRIHELVPRAAFVVYDTDTKSAHMISGPSKFSGMEDDGVGDVTFLPDFSFDPENPDGCTVDGTFCKFAGVELSNKENGKLAQIHIRDNAAIIMTKTAMTVISMDKIGQIKSNDNPLDLISQVTCAFRDLYAAVKDKVAFVEVARSHVLGFEFNDGRHMVPLPVGQGPHLVLTYMTKPSGDLKPGKLTAFKNEWWLKTIKAPPTSIAGVEVRPMEKWADLNPLKLEIMHNGKGEGVVVRVMVQTETGLVICAYIKYKADEYIAARAVREDIKNYSKSIKKLKFNPNAADLGERNEKKLRAKNAAGYPSIEAHRLEALIVYYRMFAWWLIKTCPGGEFPSWLIDFSGHEFHNGIRRGMGSMLQAFEKETGIDSGVMWAKDTSNAVLDAFTATWKVNVQKLTAVPRDLNGTVVINVKIIKATGLDFPAVKKMFQDVGLVKAKNSSLRMIGGKDDNHAASFVLNDGPSGSGTVDEVIKQLMVIAAP